MCGDCSEWSPALNEELLKLRQQNARLVGQHREQEHCARELRSEISQLRDSDSAKRVARYAQEKASCVLRHEEEVQKLRQHYEQELAAQAPVQQPSLAELERLRSSSFAEQRRADEAEAARDAADAVGVRLKKKLQKAQQQRTEQMQKVRRRSRHWMSSATSHVAMDHSRFVFSLWRAVASQKQSFCADAARWAALTLTNHSGGLRPTLLSIVASRPLLSVLAALRAWAAIISTSRDKARLDAELDGASLRATSALASLRNEVRELRVRARQAAVAGAGRRASLSLAAPFSLWARSTLSSCRGAQAVAPVAHRADNSRGAGAVVAVRLQERLSLLGVLHMWAAAAREMRHEARLKGQLDDSSMQSMGALANARVEMRTLRARCRKAGIAAVASRALVRLGAPFCAWAREMLLARAQKMDRSGDIILNSGEAAKCTQTELEEVRAQCREQLEACRSEVTEYCSVATTATRAKRRATATLDSLIAVLCKEQRAAVLQAIFTNWSMALVALTQDSQPVATASQMLDASASETPPTEQVSLRAAWGSSSDWSLQGAAFERRNATESELPSQRGSTLHDLLCARPREDSRPSTERQRDLDESGGCSTPPTPSTAASAGLEFMTLPEGPARSTEASFFFCRREERRSFLSDLLHLRERQDQEAEVTLVLLALQAWRRQSVETLRERAGLEKREAVQAAREGRKGLFVAALGQQARYWMAKAFAGWGHAVLELRCERLQAPLSKAGREGHPRTLTSTPKRPNSSSPYTGSPPRRRPNGSSPGTTTELVAGASLPQRSAHL